MYSFRRPPYLRWTAAVCIVIAALWMDLRKEPTELRPFARTSIAAGSIVETSMIEHRRVPAGLLPEPGTARYAATSIGAGEPLTPALLTDRRPLPDGWWALEMEVPAGVAPGTQLRLVLEPAATTIPAVVAELRPVDPQGWEKTTALVAVPSEAGSSVAAASAASQVGVLIASW